MTAPAVPGFTPGEATEIAPDVRRVVAPNPGVMTGPGTNTYLVGHERLAVIDPGPDVPSHLDAIVAAAGDALIVWVAVTHTHPDHAPGAAALRERTGARRIGHSSRDGFVADEEIGDGDLVGDGDRVALRAVHTPGHASNHLCYLLETERILFSGDHVMSGSTVVISPLDGDMTAYLNSLARVRGMGLRAIAPGHGGLINDPDSVLDALVAHRLSREAKVVSALRSRARSTIEDLLPAVYDDVAESRHHIARYSLWAHLRRLAEDGRARTGDMSDIGAFWEVGPKG